MAEVAQHTATSIDNINVLIKEETQAMAEIEELADLQVKITKMEELLSKMKN